MFLSSSRLIVHKSFSITTTKFAVQKFSKIRCFSTTKIVNDLPYYEGIVRDAIMATPGNTLARKPMKLSITALPDWLSKDRAEQFSSYLPAILDELEAKTATFSSFDNGKRIRRALEHFLPGGKRMVGLIIAETYKILTPEHKHTPENLKLANYLGWCWELIVEAMNMADDILDVAKTRRNRVCWHELPDVGLTAINDSFLIESGSYYLLRKYFSHLDCYQQLLEIFQESLFMCLVGQHVDVTLSKTCENLTVEMLEEIYSNISTYPAAYTTIALGMTLAGQKDLTCMKKAKKVLTNIGYFSILQGDFNDCFGEEVIGKLSTDIRERKCRWTNVVAMQLASSEQKAILKENLGRDDPKCVAKVMEIYRELNLPKVFDEYSDDLCKRLIENVNALEGDIKKPCQKLAEVIIFCKNNGLAIVT